MKVVLITTKENLQFIVDELSDILEKEDILIKVVSQKEFEFMTAKRVDIEIDLDDSFFLQLAKIAHEQDITLNQLINNVLKEQIEKIEKTI